MNINLYIKWWWDRKLWVWEHHHKSLFLGPLTIIWGK